MKSWMTEDHVLLDNLYKAFKIRKKQGLTLIPTMTTNCIRIKMTDGQDIIMYIYDEELLSFYNASDRQQSYSIHAERGFVDKLRNVIQSETGETISFYYDREVSISR
jgi:hypothetical protein